MSNLQQYTESAAANSGRLSARRYSNGPKEQTSLQIEKSDSLSNLLKCSANSESQRFLTTQKL